MVCFWKALCDFAVLKPGNRRVLLEKTLNLKPLLILKMLTQKVGTRCVGKKKYFQESAIMILDSVVKLVPHLLPVCAALWKPAWLRQRLWNAAPAFIFLISHLTGHWGYIMPGRSELRDHGIQVYKDPTSIIRVKSDARCQAWRNILNGFQNVHLVPTISFHFWNYLHLHHPK